MNLTMEDLKVITMKQPHGAIPAGLKVASIAGPDSLQPLPACPVLAVGGFTLWPMSYLDNRVSFGLVMYNLKWQPIQTVEKPGARYIFKITLQGQGNSGTVTFWGQVSQSVQLTLAEIAAMI
jgi:hypothetical protein